MFKNAENGQILLALNMYHYLEHFFENTAIQRLMEITRELPGVALVNISTVQIFMEKGNTLTYIDILK